MHSLTFARAVRASCACLLWDQGAMTPCTTASADTCADPRSLRPGLGTAMAHPSGLAWAGALALALALHTSLSLSLTRRCCCTLAVLPPAHDSTCATSLTLTVIPRVLPRHTAVLCCCLSFATPGHARPLFERGSRSLARAFFLLDPVSAARLPRNSLSRSVSTLV